MKVLIPEGIHQAGVAWLEERGYEVVSRTGADHDSLMREIMDSDAAIIRGAVIDEAILKQGAPRLKVIARHGIGYDNVDIAAAEKLGIYVTFTPQASIRTVAEHTIALIMAKAKHLKESDAYVRAGKWGEFKCCYVGTELGDSILGLIGLGRIGNEVAKIAALGFGMQVVAFDPYARKENLPEYVQLCATREEVLTQADFVSLHFPLTEQTEGSVNQAFFAAMKPSAVLINTSRGEVVDQKALTEALEKGIISGAALDVMVPEPLPANHPLSEVPNLLLTPHYATITATAQQRLAVDSARCVHAVLSGNTPLWPVNHPKT